MKVDLTVLGTPSNRPAKGRIDMIKAMATGPDGRELFATEIAKVRVRQTRLGSNGLPTRVIDMTGLSVGRFEVLGWAGINRDGRSLWRCLCECGIQRLVLGKDLRNGKMVSCGCYRVDLRIETNLTHGMTGSGTYRSYRAMLDRCYNAKQRTYAYYGALGVIVCERWRDGFEAFYNDMGERPTAMSLDRRNPFGNYEPSNCRWSTKKNQMSNQRRDAAFAVVRSLLCGGHISKATLDAAYEEVFAQKETILVGPDTKVTTSKRLKN